MNWTELANVLGNVGNFVASIGVIATVVFLAVQIRHGIRVTEEANRLAQARAQVENFVRTSHWRDRLIASDEVTDIWLRGNAGEGLTANEAERYEQMVQDLVLARAFSSQLGDAAGNRNLIAANAQLTARLARANPGFRKQLDQIRRNAPMRGFLSEFLDEVDRILREPDLDHVVSR